MDGVIMDVSGSYRDVVRQTARLFFQPAQAAHMLPDPLFELSDLAALKQSGGLNNDWDLTFAVIKLLISLANKPVIHENRNAWQRYRETIATCDVTPMADFLRADDTPLKSLLKQVGTPESEFIESLYAGDVGSGNIIKQIFQEIYLGEKLFQSTYSLDPVVYRGEGFILREKVLIDQQILEELSKDNVLAIATGRPRAEAEYPLKHFQLRPFFSYLLTLDDCLEEEKRIYAQNGRFGSLSKPNPYMLDAIVKCCKQSFSGLYYVGDMPDDMLAAARSSGGFKGIGLVLSAPDKESLRKNLKRAGADYIIDNFKDLKEIVL